MDNLNCIASETGQINFNYKVSDAKIEEFFTKKQICERCGGSKGLLGVYCNKCEDEIATEKRKEKKRLWLEERAKEDLAGRLAFVEEWIYVHMQNHPKRQMVMR